MTTLEAAICDRMDRGMLFEIYCCAYCAGAGIDDTTQHSESMRQLLWLLSDRHRTEVLLPRGYDPTPPEGRNPPGWLLGLMRQRDVIETPPIEGWPE